MRIGIFTVGEGVEMRPAKIYLREPIFCCNFALAIRNSNGEMPEWSIGAVSKTVVPFRYPGFESLSLRQTIATKY